MYWILYSFVNTFLPGWIFTLGTCLPGHLYIIFYPICLSCKYWILTVNTFQQGDVNDVMKKDPYDAIFARRLLKTK